MGAEHVQGLEQEEQRHRRSDHATRPRPAIKTTSHKYSFHVFDLSTTWLPLPYPAQLVSNIEGRWVYDEVSFNVIPTNGTKNNFSYKVQSLSVEPTAADLRKAGQHPRP